MKKYIFIIALFFIIGTPIIHADVPITTGFIPGQIWYSKEPLVDGDTVKIYTVVWNGDPDPLSARVEFYDKNVILGSRDVVVKPMTLKDVSVSWKITSGDHTISAKIISSSLATGGKNEPVTLNRATTTEDKKFVPVLVKTFEGTPVSSADIVKSNVEKASSTINSIIPDAISNPIASVIDSIDSFRDTSANTIDSIKSDTQKHIDELNANKNIKSSYQVTPKDSKILDGTEKPIAYIKLFMMSFLSFIFGNKIVFYGLCIALILLSLRIIYRKIKNR